MFSTCVLGHSLREPLLALIREPQLMSGCGSLICHREKLGK